MSLQTIYFYAGVVGVLLAVVFLAAAIVYFFKADIRGVLADLSGKEKPSSQQGESSNRKRSRPSTIQAQKVRYEGGIGHAEMRSRSGSGRRSADSYETKRNPKAALREKQRAYRKSHGEGLSTFRVVAAEASYGSSKYVNTQGKLVSLGLDENA